MLFWIYDKIDNIHSPSVSIISIAIILFSGFFLTRLTKKIKLPNVTAYILAGIFIGPYCLNAIPEHVITSTAFLPDVSLAFIAFSAGQYFKLGVLRSNLKPVMLITFFEALVASALVFLLTYGLLHLELSFAIVVSAIAATSSPASTIMTIRQTGAKGRFVDLVLQVVAVDNVIGLITYSVAITIAMGFASENLGWTIAKPIILNIFVMLAGAGFGLLMKMFFTSKRSTDNRLIIAIALLFSFCGLCAMLNISPLLGCMVMGMTYINISNDDKLFKQLEYFSPPILLMFFVRSGMLFDLKAFTAKQGGATGIPLLWISMCYFFVRIIGKYSGAFLGSFAAKEEKRITKNFGLALVPQAGVAIGLSALGARILGGEAGSSLQTIILASSILYELVGPACAKVSLYLSGSYSNKLETLVPIPETTTTGEKKSEIELLIERIQKIQEELPLYPINEAERAFTEAAENYSKEINILKSDMPTVSPPPTMQKHTDNEVTQ